MVEEYYTLYILKCKDNKLYTGITNDLDNRLKMHKEGKGSKFVRANLPFKLIYTELHKDKSSALKKESKIKKMKKKYKLQIINQTKLNK